MADKPNRFNPIHICKAIINYLMKRCDNNDIFGAPSIKDIFKVANHIGYSEGGLVAIGEHTSVIKIHNPWGKRDEVNMDKPSARINPKRYCRHVCLDCGHEDRVEGYFHEVINCPKCGGLYVDTFRVLHYQALLRPDKTKDDTPKGTCVMPKTIQKSAKEKVIALLTDYDVAFINYNAKEDEYCIRIDKEKIYTDG